MRHAVHWNILAISARADFVGDHFYNNFLKASVTQNYFRYSNFYQFNLLSYLALLLKLSLSALEKFNQVLEFH